MTGTTAVFFIQPGHLPFFIKFKFCTSKKYFFKVYESNRITIKFLIYSVLSLKSVSKFTKYASFFGRLCQEPPPPLFVNYKNRVNNLLTKLQYFLFRSQIIHTFFSLQFERSEIGNFNYLNIRHVMAV